jgi:hypothetical protein
MLNWREKSIRACFVAHWNWKKFSLKYQPVWAKGQDYDAMPEVTLLLLDTIFS